MRFEGTLKSWNDDRGFGFIEPAQGGQEIFVHVKAFPRGAKRPQPGQLVSFEVELGPQGKKRARNVQAVQPARSRARRRHDAPAAWSTPALLAIPVFLAVFVAVNLAWGPPLWVALVYLVASILTFIAYAIDKSSAQRGQWRTRESTLHLFAVAGGWPGALLAQQLFRHKSSKSAFRWVFWLTVVANVAGFVALCSPGGRQLWAV